MVCINTSIKVSFYQSLADIRIKSAHNKRVKTLNLKGESLETFLVLKAMLDSSSELLVRQPALLGGALGVLLL